MNEAHATETKEREPYFPGPIALGLAFVALLVVAAYFFFTHPNWWWGRIGSIVALVTVVLLLFRDWLKEYGEDFGSRTEAQQWKKLTARFIATGMTSIGAALLIIAAVYQLTGDPVMVITAPPKDLVFKAAGSKERVDGQQLIGYLNSVYDNLKRIDQDMAALSSVDLVTVNCGSEHSDEKCVCPEHYARVRHIGKWDLNAGATGDGITLCYRNVAFPRAPK